MKLIAAKTRGHELLREHGLEQQGWVIEFDNAKGRLGQCRYNKRVISLSRVHTEAREDAEVEQTLLHEIAHALVGPAHGHDYVWLAKARSIGYTGSRTTKSSAEVVYPWVGVCSGCGRVASKQHRAPLRVKFHNCTGKMNSYTVLEWKRDGINAPLITMPTRYRAEHSRLAALGIL